MVGPSMKWKAFCCFGILRDDTGIRLNLCGHSCLLSARVRASGHSYEISICSPNTSMTSRVVIWLVCDTEWNTPKFITIARLPRKARLN